MDTPEKFAPLLTEWDNGGKPARSAEEWCVGFVRGVGLRRKDWEPLLSDGEMGDLFGQILRFASGKVKPKAHGGPQVKTARKLQGLLGYIAQRIYALWQPRREKRKPGITTQMFHLAGPPNVARKPEVRRNPPCEPKAGRNDPCPCGSGKKFKKCCGRGATPN
jgi:uncharacterized protein